MSSKLNFAPEFFTLPGISRIDKIKLSNSQTQSQHNIPNLPGKQASLKIYNYIAQHNVTDSPIISAAQAELGLILFGDYTAEEKNNPNSHPNIRLLMDTIENNYSWQVEIVNK